MKRLFLTVVTALIGLSLSAQTIGTDKLSISIGDITGGDTTLMANSKKLKDCAGNLVRFTLVVQNTDAVTDTFNVGGEDPDITYDIDVFNPKDTIHYETIASSALPFVIDTSTIAPASGGMTKVGDYYVKTIWLTDFPYQKAGVYLSKSALTQGDFDIYIKNIKQK